MRLIGLHARLSAGKDSAFETISQAAENESALAIRRAFADPLKISGLRALGEHYSADNEDEALALANRIKETGRITVTWEDAEGLRLQATTISGRQFWQWYGTEAHRESDLGASFGPDFWVDNLLPLGTRPVQKAVYDEVEQPLFWDNFTESWAGFADLAVVTDVRFPNEAQRILDLDGEVWWINAEERLGPNEDAHPSEQKLPDHYITHVVQNNGSVAEFQNNILEALNS